MADIEIYRKLVKIMFPLEINVLFCGLDNVGQIVLYV